MNTVIDTQAPDRRKHIGLLPGSIAAAFLALVFGACLLTILDAMHPPPPAASSASALSRASHTAAKVVTASF